MVYDLQDWLKDCQIATAAVGAAGVVMRASQVQQADLAALIDAPHHQQGATPYPTIVAIVLRSLRVNLLSHGSTDSTQTHPWRRCQHSVLA
jgi:hypothetical protein